MYLLQLIFVFISCNIYANETLSKYLISTYKIEVINENVINNEEINLAPNTYFNILKFHTLTTSNTKKIMCLNIKSKHELEKGHFYLTEAQNEDCEVTLIGQEYLWQRMYYNFMLKINRNYLSLKIDTKMYDYNFVNIKSNLNEKYASHQKMNKYGATMLLIGEGGQEFPSIKDGEICRLVNDECEVIFDKCSQCENSSYYFKNNSCTSVFSKTCGEDKCGNRSEVACIRGHVATGVSDYCIQDSPVGFCKEDLRVACVNNVLICE